MSQPEPVSAPSSAKWWVLFTLSLLTFGNYYAYDAIAPLASQLSSELGFSSTQIGSLNAVYSLPNIFLVLIGGLLVDKFGTGRLAVWTAGLCFLGIALTATFGEYLPMVAGRLLFGIGSETMLVAASAALGIWFGRNVVGLAMAVNLSVGRMGSYAADLSPVWAGGLYDQGWQGPMILAATLAGMSYLCAWAYKQVDKPRHLGLVTVGIEPASEEKISLRDIFHFNRSFWYITILNVLFYSVIFPFRSTFAIKYFQDAHGQSLEQAATLNSYVFLAAIIFTPLFGWTADRFGHRGKQMVFGSLLLPLSFLGLMSEEWGLWMTTAFLGISFSLIPAILWPSVVKLVKKHQLGTAYGLMFMVQAIGVGAANMIAGMLNDAAGASADNPAGYVPMLIFFAVTASSAFVFAIALWRREIGPHGHGLEVPR
jgi:MFS family permease